jgi:hypothetical protein
LSKAEPTSDEILGKYRRGYLYCRADRHHWGRKAFYYVLDRISAERHVICTDCGTRRVEEIDTRNYQRVPGRPVKYRYASGYLTPKSGLVLGDFRSRMLEEDFAAAEKRGQVDYPDEDAPDPELAPQLEAVPDQPRKRKAS